MESSVVKHIPSAEPQVVDQLREGLRGLMWVEDVTLQSSASRPEARFRGTLVEGDQNAIFDEIVSRFEALGYTPFLSEEDDLHVLRAWPVVAKGRTGKPWVNAVLFALTVLSVLFIGALHENADLAKHPLDIWRGWPFAVGILGILTTHELSHYWVGRHHGSPVSLPYFIPVPGILGTMGAVIVQRAPMRSRKALFDIGAAGPLGGLLVAVPLLVLGLVFSRVGQPLEFMDISTLDEPVVTQEGNSLLYLAAKYAVFGRILPDRSTGEDVWLSPPSPGGSMAFAAWAGLLVTALNLFPIGQFDGGHIAYALWGRKAWTIARAFLVAAFAWGLFLMLMRNVAGGTWLTWGALGLLMGPRHPPPLNDLTPLDPKRRLLGWVIVVIFILILIPVPLVQVTL